MPRTDRDNFIRKPGPFEVLPGKDLFQPALPLRLILDPLAPATGPVARIFAAGIVSTAGGMECVWSCEKETYPRTHGAPLLARSRSAKEQDRSGSSPRPRRERTAIKNCQTQPAKCQTAGLKMMVDTKKINKVNEMYGAQGRDATNVSHQELSEKWDNGADQSVPRFSRTGVPPSAPARTAEFELARQLTLTHARRFSELKFNTYDRIIKDPAIKTSALACRLAWVILDHVNLQTRGARAGCAWPSHDYLANELGVSEKGVRNAIKLLEDLGYLFVLHTRRRGNRYVMNVARALDQADEYRCLDVTEECAAPNRDRVITELELPDNGTPVLEKRNSGTVHPSYETPDKRLSRSRPSKARERGAHRLADVSHQKSKRVGPSMPIYKARVAKRCLMGLRDPSPDYGLVAALAAQSDAAELIDRMTEADEAEAIKISANEGALAGVAFVRVNLAGR